MNRLILAFIFFATLLAAATPAFSATAFLVDAPARNFLRNPGFDGAEYWILKGEGTTWEASGGRSEGGAVRMRDAAQAELVQTIGPTLVGGRRYALSAWVRSHSPGAVAVVGARWEGGHPRVFRGVEPDDGWIRIELRFEAPEGTGWRQAVLGGTGDLVWDDVTLVEAETLEARLAAEWEGRLAAGDPVYTGLVIHAIGTPLERGMSPRIYDANGQLVFAGMDAGEAQVVAEGLVAYATDLRQAVQHPRLRVSEAYPMRLPLVVDAQGVIGLPPTGVVIGAADAERIRQAVKEYDFLGRFAVVFVVEPFSGL